MKIRTIPEEIDELLSTWQKKEILRRIQEPMVAVGEDDPLWEELESACTIENQRLILTHAVSSIHEIRPGLTLVWIDAWREPGDPKPAMLLNARHLAILRKRGLAGWEWDSFVSWFEQ